MINPDNRELEMTHDNELAYMLSKFNSDFIYMTVQESLNTRLRYYSMGAPNIISSYETIFKQMLVNYDDPDAHIDIEAKRQETYMNILKMICDYYQFVYQDWDTYDLYTSVLYIYDLFVSNFQQYVIEFFVNFIVKEKNGLYQTITVDEEKKGIGLAYSKKVIKDPKLAVICNFLDEIIATVCNMDIDLHQFISIALSNSIEKDIAKIKEERLNAVLSTPVDFMKTFIAPIFAPESTFATTMFSSIKLILQQYALDSAPNENINITTNN